MRGIGYLDRPRTSRTSCSRSTLARRSPRRRRAHGLVVQPRTAGRSASASRRRHRGHRVVAARPESVAGPRGHHAKVEQLNVHAAQGHADRAHVRPQRSHRPHAENGPRESSHRLSPDNRHGVAVPPQRRRLHVVAVVIPLALLIAFPGLYAAGPAREPDFDGRHRFRHPSRRRRGARRERVHEVRHDPTDRHG